LLKETTAAPLTDNINFGEKNINFTSLPFKNNLTNSNANSILYNLRGSSLRMKRLKALTQRTFPGDFRMAWSFCAQAICSFSI
jgi:hypothetical protein